MDDVLGDLARQPLAGSPQQNQFDILPLKKRVGSWEVRPIAIPMLFHKAATATLQKELTPGGTQLCGDFQHGVGATDGITDLVRKIASWMQCHPAGTVLQLDMSNAFGTINRGATVSQLRKLGDPASRIAEAMLGSVQTATAQGGTADIPTGGGIPPTRSLQPFTVCHHNQEGLS